MYPDKRDGTIHALDEEKRNLMLVSRDLRVIATNFRPGLRRMGKQCMGRTCHELLYNQDLPCSPCLAIEVLRTGKRAARKVGMIDGKSRQEA